MNNFYSQLQYWNSIDINSYIKNCTPEDVQKVLNKYELDEKDFLTLVSPSADNYLEDIAKRAHDVTIREFGRTIQLYTPLYLSNFCQNRCTYCGFNIENEILRTKLTDEEILIEGQKIRDLGIKHILLLTGGDRVNTPMSYIRNAVSILDKLFDSISIEMYAMSKKEYKSLFDMGVDNVTIYQETYNQERYRQVHLKGEKSSYDFRLEAPERAASAGARSVNLGVLLGLDSPISDFFKAALHCNYIRNSYPGCDVSISLPRIREAIGGFKPEELVTDRLLTKLIMAFRLFIPRGGISLSTRESSRLRDSLLPLGVTKMSAQSRTSVGGHNKTKSENQFEISDERTVEELDSDLRSKGYQPVYKDWVLL